ncbi:hypothetical protein [Streptomyces broussonetiae]|uniref:hypothetical protein n=1 Tax=Streptomyces broussonetiae TaxID=2686304 RepID=UPI00131CC7A5|nr:hypothetical protein [Streptomyces broussonetiae]
MDDAVVINERLGIRRSLAVVRAEAAGGSPSGGCTSAPSPQPFLFISTLTEGSFL